MVLIKYSGKYVKIYFNMKITFLNASDGDKRSSNEGNMNKKYIKNTIKALGKVKTSPEDEDLANNQKHIQVI